MISTVADFWNQKLLDQHIYGNAKIQNITNKTPVDAVKQHYMNQNATRNSFHLKNETEQVKLRNVPLDSKNMTGSIKTNATNIKVNEMYKSHLLY